MWLLAACGTSVPGNGAPDAGPDVESALLEITVTPADQHLVIDGDVPATQGYTAVGRFEDGTTADISDRVRFFLESPLLGSFAGSQLTSTTAMGGRTRVVAALDGVTGSTGLVLTLRKRHADPASSDLPADLEEAFSGPDDPGRAPGLVYPNDGVILPPNLRLLEFHFLPGEGNDLFEVSFENELTDVKVYARCTTPVAGGCVYLPDDLIWGWIAATNRGDAELEVRVRGTGGGAGGGVGASASLRVGFAYEDVLGGIYYWKAEVGGESAIMRYDFGHTVQSAAEKFVGPEKAGGKCVGCHALSRDGRKMVTAAGGWDVEDILLLDVASGDRLGAPAKSAFSSWDPAGSAYVGVFAYQGTTSYDLLLFDGSSGQLTGTIDVGATAARATTHPDWSPDGSRIAYVRAGAPYENGVNNQRFYRGAIEMVAAEGAGWSAPVVLVPEASDRNHYYPSFAPDGELLVYNRSICPGGELHRDCNADSNPSAAMFVIRPEAGAQPIELSRANAPGPVDSGAELTNSWPRWAPFEARRSAEDGGSRIYWVTFSSTRQVGLRSPPPATSDQSVSGTLLWMVAIDPDRALAGEDPSYPAFYLPFQEITTSNHIAQWTEEVVVIP